MLVQLADDPEDLAHDQRREPERRLVEHQQLRPPHQSTGEREHLLLAARERARPLLATLGDPGEIRRHPVDVRLQRSLRPRVAAEPQVLDDREIGERSAPLGNVGDARLRDRLGPAAQRLPVEDDLTAAPHGAGHRAQRRRLAGAVRAEDGDDRALGTVIETPRRACTGP